MADDINDNAVDALAVLGNLLRQPPDELARRLVDEMSEDDDRRETIGRLAQAAQTRDVWPDRSVEGDSSRTLRHWSGDTIKDHLNELGKQTQMYAPRNAQVASRRRRTRRLVAHGREP